MVKLLDLLQSHWPTKICWKPHIINVFVSYFSCTTVIYIIYEDIKTIFIVKQYID